ncbi:MAG: hypothetical protein KAI24_04860 [Planctomycetes bacterium]|nr:hypothetical protein [Planctomycetota bacterium]
MFALRLLSLSVALAAAAAAQTPILLNGQVWDGNGGPLLAGQVYHVISTGGSCGISVPSGQTLTVQPGAIVKVGGCLLVSGDLQAVGTPTQPIVWTSIEDDSFGGDTNGNGALTVPARGDWDTIELFGTMTMEHCRIRYGGRNNGAALSLRNNPAVVRDTLIEHGDAKGMRDCLDATIERCTFENLTQHPVEGLDLRRLGSFVDNTASLCDGGEYARITIGGLLTSNVTMDASHSINGSGLFVLRTGSVWSPRVAAGVTLTLPAGTILKMENTRLTSVGGRIVAQGGLGGAVVVTSIHDDTYGGDTQKDGGATAPAAGDWQLLDLQPGDSSSLTGLVVRYAGNPAISASGSSGTLLGCLIEQGVGDGVRFGNLASPPTTMIGCAIRDNGGRAVRDMEWPEVAAAYGNTTSNNAGGDAFHVLSGFVTVPSRIAPENYPGDAVVVQNRVTVQNGGELTFEAGVVVKWASFNSQTGFNVNAGGRLFANGTARRPVVVTTILDDAFGGDTNGDGGATTPSPGDWGYVRLGGGTGIDQVRLEHVRMRYGGRYGHTLDCNNALAVLRAVRIEHSELDGLLFGNGAIVHNLIVHAAGRDGVLLQNGACDLLHATVTGCGGYGMRRSGGWSGTVRNTICWGNAVANFDGLVAADVHASNGGFAGQNGNLDVDPQFVAAASGDLRLQATSPCLGAGEFATAQAVVVDHAASSRLQDHALVGSLQADMGAFERAPYRLDPAGDAVIGATLSFTLQGPPGVGATFLSLTPSPGVLLAPFGFALIGVPNAPLLPSVLLPGQAATFAIPNDPLLVDVRFDVQGLGLQLTSPLVGGFTNVDRNRVRLP